MKEDLNRGSEGEKEEENYVPNPPFPSMRVSTWILVTDPLDYVGLRNVASSGDIYWLLPIARTLGVDLSILTKFMIHP